MSDNNMPQEGTPLTTQQQQPYQQQPYQQQSYQQQPYQQQSYQQQPYPNQGFVAITPEQRVARGMAIASMVLGIVALVLCWIFYLSIPCGLVGLIMGIIAMKKGERGMATAGLVCSIIALVIAIIIVVFFVVAFSSLSSFYNAY